MGGESRSDRDILMARVEVPEHVVRREFSEETVALNLRTGRYHGLNPTAGRMLEALADAATVDEAAGRLAEALGQPRERIERDLAKLCTELAERGLIELDGDEG
jgi:hypothetical protein